MPCSRSRIRAALVAAGLLAAAPAPAQWFGSGPIPPGEIVGSLMRRGFLDIGRPRFDGAVYVVEGTNARGLRVRLVIDAFDGDVISRTRLDAPLLPPREVGRERAPRLDAYPSYPPEEMEEAELPPRALGRAPGRGFVEREDLPPPPMMQPRRSDLPPPVIEPRLGPPEAPPPSQRQARRPEGTPRSPTALPPAEPKPEVRKEKRPATAAAPKVPAKPAETAPVAPSAPAPAIEGEAREASPPKSVRVIEGVTPVVPKAAEAAPADAPKPAPEPGGGVTVPPAPLE